MRDRSEFTLRKQSDFSRVYKKGSSRGSRFAVILYRKNSLGYTRTAFVASRKVGNSVTRNRARRLMKESYRELQPYIAKGYDIIFVARNTISDSNKDEVERVMRSALKGEGLLSKHQ